MINALLVYLLNVTCRLLLSAFTPRLYARKVVQDRCFFGIRTIKCLINQSFCGIT